ncbi:hypothetical protein [Streptomyces sp. NBC_01205]|uniref:hypothetical protein n=1 Tax=Streptomyces sp. NBC_01205 TaxID=2903771 RepID=UPI002E15CCBC|nr:hypothetical protein OG573_33595 [Streptomyces sp. NBC_01205]
MARSAREQYDESQAAGRLRVPLAAWRWAVGSGLVPPADAGRGLWSRAVVEAADPEQVRAALWGPIGAGVAAERLTEALGVPLPILRPRVTATAVGHLVKAGLLVCLGGDTQFPDVHPDQVAALARRRDLPALLDRHVPLGPDQAARRLGVRRTDFDLIAGRLGWLSPVGSVDVDYKHHGGVTAVPLYDAQEIALLEVVRPTVDWRAVRTVTAGRRSPLAGLRPVAPGGDRVFLAGVARIARVGRAAVVNWRRRHPDFPTPVAGTDVHPQLSPGSSPTTRSKYPPGRRSPRWCWPGPTVPRTGSASMTRGWPWPTTRPARTACPGGPPTRTRTRWPPWPAGSLGRRCAG